MTKRNFLSGLLFAAMGIMLLFKSGELSEGIRRGLYICSYSVIPSLFPFMALSVFICKSSAADFFAAALKPLTKFLRLPSYCAGAIFASAIGGYPTAAKCINDLVLDGIIDRDTASKMLCYCVNAGPAFIISTVGISVFGNIKTGLFILIAHILSSGIIAVFLSLFSKKQCGEFLPEKVRYKNSSAGAVEAVVSAAESCFRMCAFIVLSSGVLELLEGGAIFSAISESPAIKTLFCGFFEVTAGVISSGNIDGFSAVIIAGALVSFSGISVMLQVAAAVDESKIPLFPFFVSRFFHAAITAGILRIFLIFSKDTSAVFSFRGSETEAVLSASAPAAVSLLCMASLFLLSLVPPKSEKEPLFSRIKYKLTVFRHSQIK